MAHTFARSARAGNAKAPGSAFGRSGAAFAPHGIRAFSNSRHVSTREGLLEVGEAVGENGVDRRVFGQLVRIDLVERVRGSVMIVEVVAAVLDRADIGHAHPWHR